jgi:hypothetical protein
MKCVAKKKEGVLRKAKEMREEKETSKTKNSDCFPYVTNFNTIYLQDVTSCSL